jgi:hypothetical protein
MKKIALLLTSLFFACGALAQIVVSPGISYTSDKVDVTQPASISGASYETQETRVDMRLGYILPMGLYLGANYAHVGQTIGNDSSSGYLAGPSIGYFSHGTGFYGLLTYHVMGEMGDSTKFTGAQGPQVDVGWIFPITSVFSIGPQLTWRSIEFGNIESGGTSVNTDYKRDTIAPYVSLWFMF